MYKCRANDVLKIVEHASGKNVWSYLNLEA